MKLYESRTLDWQYFLACCYIDYGIINKADWIYCIANNNLFIIVIYTVDE